MTNDPIASDPLAELRRVEVPPPEPAATALTTIAPASLVILVALVSLIALIILIVLGERLADPQT